MSANNGSPRFLQFFYFVAGIPHFIFLYGDIGTSPLYAVKEAFAGAHPMAVTPGNVLGVLSLVFWPLLIVVSIKSVTPFQVT